MKILIFGAGSIGNHMAYASRQLDYDVFITDISQKSLLRMKNSIYPKRYKKWDHKIKIVDYKNIHLIDKKFDLIIIGTPPESHLSTYYFCKKNLRYSKILIEKPLTNYRNKLLQKFSKERNHQSIFCGYNHSVSKAFIYFEKEMQKLKKVEQINVSWKENWDGILNAHFWLKNVSESYLGNLKDGGGALQEHSHGLHLLHIILKKRKINLSNSNIVSSYIMRNKKYDIFFSISGYQNNILYNYQTDLITKPAEKTLSMYSDIYQLKLIFNSSKNRDTVILYEKNKIIKKKNFLKTRSSEFKNEIRYILNKKKKNEETNLSIKNAIEVTKTINRVIHEAR